MIRQLLSPSFFCSLDNSQVEQTSLIQGVKLFFKRELLVYKTVFGSQEVKNAVKIIDFNLRNKLIHILLVK